MWIFMLKFAWDITTLFEKYLPMPTVYKVLGLGWTKLGYYVFRLLWFIFVVLVLYNVLGQEAFDKLINEL